jgi:arsenite methyltransferase
MRAMEPRPPDPSVKACCAALYGSEWATFLLGDSFHPGGLQLTERLGGLLDLGPDRRVLDVAAGRGTSALALARRFGCQVTCVDFAPSNLRHARAAAEQAGLTALVDVVAGDAEALPFDDASFDAIICECALCTFPNKTTAAAEFARVLRPGGRIGLSDVTRVGSLPVDLDSVLAMAACIADAQSAEGYAELLRAAGLAAIVIERHDGALLAMIDLIKTRLVAAQLLVRTRTAGGPGFDLTSARTLAKRAAQAIGEGALGYALLTATKPLGFGRSGGS